MSTLSLKHFSNALILLVIALVAVNILPTSSVLSQEVYLEPLGQIAEAGPLNSGYIRIQWQKPSDDVIGYQILRRVETGGERKRSDLTGEDIIGADSVIFYDTDIMPLVNYGYNVKAIYVGGESAYAYPTAKAIAPDYCPSGCVSVSPLMAGSGTTLVDFNNTRLHSSLLSKKITLDTPIPAGRYQITTYSFDTYEGRSADTETNERWLLFFKNGGTIIGQTGLTTDLRDGVEAVGKPEVIETEFVLSEPADSITAVHGGWSLSGASEGLPADSVFVGNIAITDMATGADKCLLVVEKEADKTEVSFGDELTYTITVRNDGGKNCTGGGNYIYDYVPEELEYVSETHTPNVDISRASGDAYDPATRQLWWVATTPLVPGEVAVVAWTGRVIAGAESESCDGSGTDDVIENRAFVTNTQYAARSIPVRSNTNSITCEPPEEPVIEATIVPSPNPSYPGGEVTWTATPFGECPGPFSYSWTGDDSLTGNGASVSHIYDDPGSYYATVTISAPNCETLVKESPTPVVVEFFVPSSVSCTAAPGVVEVGRSVNWRATVEPSSPPGGGSYTFSWSGDDGLSGTGPSITKTYDSVGVKNATVVVGGGVQELASCSVMVKERARPKYEEI